MLLWPRPCVRMGAVTRTWLKSPRCRPSTLRRLHVQSRRSGLGGAGSATSGSPGDAGLLRAAVRPRKAEAAAKPQHWPACSPRPRGSRAVSVPNPNLPCKSPGPPPPPHDTGCQVSTQRPLRLWLLVPALGCPAALGSDCSRPAVLLPAPLSRVLLLHLICPKAGRGTYLQKGGANRASSTGKRGREEDLDCEGHPGRTGLQKEPTVTPRPQRT